MGMDRLVMLILIRTATRTRRSGSAVVLVFGTRVNTPRGKKHRDAFAIATIKNYTLLYSV